MPIIKMRDYQTEALDALARGRAEGQTKQLVVLPTGSGKTIVAAEDIRRVVERTGRGALFIAHRDELIKQPAQKIPLVWDNPDIGRVKAEDNELGHKVTVASVQTISRDKRLRQIVEAQKYSILYIDEAHHAPAKTYMKIVNAVVEANPEIKVVGLTATPVRADKTKMKEVFADITYEKSILDLIKSGYLTDLKLKQVPLDASIDGIKKSGGDLKPSEVRQIVTKPHIMVAMVDAWKNTAVDRRTIAFAVDVEHAHKLAACFRAKDVKADVIFGDMPQETREKHLDDFQRGKLQVLVNCMILTEGFDDIALENAPPLSCIMLARPTLSQSLYIQQIGRGTRPAPMKKNCLILDFSYNSKRHHIVQLPHLFGLKSKSTKVKGEKEEILENGEEQIPSILEAVLAEAENVDISQPPPRAGFRWAESSIGFVLSIGRDYGHMIIRPTDEDRSLFNVFHLEPPEEVVREGRHARSEEFKEHKLTSKPLSHEWAFGLAEDACRKIFNKRYYSPTANKMIDKEAEWLTLPPTDKQLTVLARMGKKAKTRAEASNIISARIIEKTYRDREPATKKQKGFLRWKKIKFKEPLTKGEASRLIGQYNHDQKKKQQRELF